MGSYLRVNPDGYECDSRLRFPESRPVTEINIDPPEIAGLSSSELKIIGFEVSHRLTQEKASYGVVRYKRPIVKLKEQEKIVMAALPPAVTERSIFDLTLHVGMLLDKFVYHIPLSRQWERMQALGGSVESGDSGESDASSD